MGRIKRYKWLLIVLTLCVTFGGIANAGSSNAAPAPVKSIAVAGAPFGVDSQGTFVWVSGLGGIVTKIDRATGAVLASITVTTTGQLMSLSSDGTNVWVTSQDAAGSSVFQIDVVSASLVRTIPIAGLPWAIDADGTNVWVSTYRSTSGCACVIKIDAATGSIIQSTNLYPGLNAFGVISDGNHVWVGQASCDNCNWITELDAATGTILRRIDVPSLPYSITKLGQYIWGASNSGTVFQVDTVTGATVRTISTQTTNLASISAGAGYIWVGDANAEWLKVLSPDSGNVLETFTGVVPWRIAGDDDGVWATNLGQARVYQFAYDSLPSPTTSTTSPTTTTTANVEILHAEFIAQPKPYTGSRPSVQGWCILHRLDASGSIVADPDVSCSAMDLAFEGDVHAGVKPVSGTFYLAGSRADRYALDSTHLTTTMTVLKRPLYVRPNNLPNLYAHDPAPDYTYRLESLVVRRNYDDGNTGFAGDETPTTALDFIPPTCTSSYSPDTIFDARGALLGIRCSAGSARDYSFEVSALGVFGVGPPPISSGAGKYTVNDTAVSYSYRAPSDRYGKRYPGRVLISSWKGFKFTAKIMNRMQLAACTTASVRCGSLAGTGRLLVWNATLGRWTLVGDAVQFRAEAGQDVNSFGFTLVGVNLAAESDPQVLVLGRNRVPYI